MNAVKVFLRGVWKCLPDEEDVSWVNRIASSTGSNEPLGDYGPIIKEMLDKGIAPQVIARFAKIIGYETAFALLYHLDDPNASYEGFPDEYEEHEWGLYLLDPVTNEPISPLNGLYESLLSTDPSGHEMRPKRE